MDLYDLIIQNKYNELERSLNQENINETYHSDILLQRAIAYDRHEIANTLVNKAVNVNHTNDNNDTALHYCADRGDDFYDTAKLILENGGDLSIADKYGNQPLWTATMNSKGRYYAMVELFVKYGANPNHVNNAGRSPLDFAKTRKDQKLIEMLSV
ncbi:MAG: ankyrin repeat domain-containing protein [Proteobacteria bacterium]|nr:ankyrin repeat domain-containing protein [Pseudomonadota bacterium]